MDRNIEDNDGGFQVTPRGNTGRIDRQSAIYVTLSYLSPSKNGSGIFRKLCSEVADTGKGEVIVAPFDVYLDETRNVVQPDIIVVLNENRSIIDEAGHIHGVPDLLVDVLSPANKDHDLIRKMELYERFGVKEYWIVEPDNNATPVYELADNRYHLIAEDVGIVKSGLLQTSIVF